MKKAIIVTVYNSENCGSFLQAYAMMKTLMRMGYQVSFLKRSTKNTSHDFRKTIKKIVKHLHNLDFSKAISSWKQWYKFNVAQRAFNVCDLKDNCYRVADLIVLGSDTIWNFDSEYFVKNASRYTGSEFTRKKVISYAASVGNTSLEKFKSIVSNTGGLTNLESVLVRDKQTQIIVESTTSKKANIVCDPTLLLSKGDYNTFLCKYPHKQKCLVLYCFDDIDRDIRETIISYARNNNLIIASLIKYFSWADINPITCPENLITYYSNAVAVVTDTFHGTAFSINFGIPFAVIDRGKMKVKELLTAYNATDHEFSKVDEFEHIIDNMDFSLIKTRIQAIRTESLQLLKETII